MLVRIVRRKAKRAGGRLYEFPKRPTMLSQACLSGRIEKKPLSVRVHRCDYGLLPLQRELFYAFLARFFSEDRLAPACLRRQAVRRARSHRRLPFPFGGRPALMPRRTWETATAGSACRLIEARRPPAAGAVPHPARPSWPGVHRRFFRDSFRISQASFFSCRRNHPGASTNVPSEGKPSARHAAHLRPWSTGRV